MRAYTLFIAEDDEDDYLFMSEAFKKQRASCQLVHFFNGADLLEHLATLSVDNLPDLIILDINMPKIDGMQALQKIREQTHLASVPVIVHTTSDCRNQKEKCLLLGANAFITKGMELKAYAELANTILQLLKG